MAWHSYFIVDAFTRTPFAGNPAGVVFQDGSLTEAQMRSVAGELGLETAFLTPMEDGEAQYQVAYYTAASRIPLCGHDTVAAAAVLAHLGRLPTPGRVQFATDIGILEIEVGRNGKVKFAQGLPHFGASVSTAEAAAMLDLDSAALADAIPPQIVSTGSPFLFTALKTRAALNSLEPDMRTLADAVAGLPGGALGVYAWTFESVSPEALIHARCFAPGVGLPEDPVTGSASGALGTYLNRYGLVTPDENGIVEFSTEQGYAMGRPGQAGVRLEVQGERVERVQVAGHAVVAAEGRIRV